MTGRHRLPLRAVPLKPYIPMHELNTIPQVDIENCTSISIYLHIYIYIYLLSVNTEQCDTANSKNLTTWAPITLTH